MLEDKQIIKLCKSGRIDLLELLVERHKNSLYKFCRHLVFTGNDAEDLFQETWIRVLQHLDHFDEEKSFCNWLFSIALNTYRDRYRKAKRWLNKFRDFFSNEEKDAKLSGIPCNDPSIEEQVADRELKTQLIQCINTLEDTFRIPVVLFYFKQFQYEDIADILDIPVGTVKSRLNAAKSKLRKLMEVNGHEGRKA